MSVFPLNTKIAKNLNDFLISQPLNTFEVMNN